MNKIRQLVGLGFILCCLSACELFFPPQKSKPSDSFFEYDYEYNGKTGHRRAELIPRKGFMFDPYANKVTFSFSNEEQKFFLNVRNSVLSDPEENFWIRRWQVKKEGDSYAITSAPLFELPFLIDKNEKYDSFSCDWERSDIKITLIDTIQSRVEGEFSGRFKFAANQPIEAIVRNGKFVFKTPYIKFKNKQKQ